MYFFSILLIHCRSEIVTSINKLWPGIKVVHGRPRHSQSQGAIERVNREYRKKLRQWCLINQSPCWSIGAMFVRAEINNSKHTTTGKSPYETVFGCTPRLGIKTLPINPEILKHIFTEDEFQEYCNRNRIDFNIAPFDESATSDPQGGDPLSDEPSVCTGTPKEIAWFNGNGLVHDSLFFAYNHCFNKKIVSTAMAAKLRGVMVDERSYPEQVTSESQLSPLFLKYLAECTHDSTSQITVYKATDVPQLVNHDESVDCSKWLLFPAKVAGLILSFNYSDLLTPKHCALVYAANTNTWHMRKCLMFQSAFDSVSQADFKDSLLNNRRGSQHLEFVSVIVDCDRDLLDKNTKFFVYGPNYGPEPIDEPMAAEPNPEPNPFSHYISPLRRRSAMEVFSSTQHKADLMRKRANGAGVLSVGEIVQLKIPDEDRGPMHDPYLTLIVVDV